MEDTVRWSLKVSRETDEALRAYLGQTGGRKGDLSKFVQKAVRSELQRASTTRAKTAARSRADAGLAEALAEVRARTSKLSQARFEKLVAEAVAYARRRR
jgi:hypothetical protein